MKKQTVINLGLSGLMMLMAQQTVAAPNESSTPLTGMVMHNPVSSNAVHILHNKDVLLESGLAHSHTHTVSEPAWQIKAAGFIGCMGTFVALAVYVHLS